MTITVLSHGLMQGGADGAQVTVDTSGANLIVFAINTYADGPDPTGNDSKGNVWTLLTPRENIGRVQLLYCINPIVGVGHTFGISGTGIYATLAYLLVNITGNISFVAENGAIALQSQTLCNTGSVPSGGISSIAVTALAANDATGRAIGSGFTLARQADIIGGVAFDIALAYKWTTSSENALWTWTAASPWATAIASFAETAAPAGTTGTGALVAGAATLTGAGVSRSTGAGVLAAQAAALSGIGSAFSVTAGTGALIAQRAVVSGVGTSRSTGVGTLVAQAASLAGTGAAQGAGMGVLAARNAVIVGTGTIGLATVSGAGVLAAGAALVTGTGVILAVATGQGALAAGQASLSATGTSETTGTGALAARAATLAGQFIVTTGVGILNAGRAKIVGAGTTTGDSSSVDFEGDLVDVIGPLVGGRAYPNTYPQDCIWPAIRYTLVSVDPADDLCSHAEEEDGVETSDVRVQFDLVAETYTQSRDLRVAMRKAMRGFDPPALMSAEFNTYDVETKVHRVVMDYVFYPSSD